MTEIARGIHRIEIDLAGRTNALHLFLGTDRTLLVDTGMADDLAVHLLPYLDRVGVGNRLTDVLNTHGDVDHFGGNGTARQLFPAVRIRCHEADRYLVEDTETVIRSRYGEFRREGLDDPDEAYDWMRRDTRAVPVDGTVADDETLDLGDGWTVRVIALPGHSHGSIGVWDPRSRTAVIGDAALGATVPFADGRPAFPPTYRHLREYRASAARLLDLAPDLLLTSHYPPYRAAGVGEFLQSTTAFTDHLEALVLELLAETPSGSTISELAERSVRRLGTWEVESARVAMAQPLAAHLEDLVAAGTVRETGGNGRRRWHLHR